MRTLVGPIGAAAVALGGLWLLQGLGVVHLRPILCVAACEAVQAPSAGWAIAGAALALLGAVVLAVVARRRRQR